MALAFLEELETLTGVTPMIYCDSDAANHLMDDAVARYPLWVADWEVDSPRVYENWASWTGWQYTDRGEVPGITGYVDRDRFTEGVLLTEEERRPQVVYTVQPGERIAQLVLLPVFLLPVEEVEELSQTQRGEGGFGSTGR